MKDQFKYVEIVADGVTNRGTYVEKFNWEIDYVNEDKTDTYHSAFMHTSELIEYTDKFGGKSGYDGRVGGKYLFWDLDNTDINKAKEDAKILVTKLSEYSRENIEVYFSGCKGFHILYYCPELTRFDHINEHHTLVKNVCSYIAYGLECFDSHIYDKTRIIRSPNTVNSKTGLYKIRLPLEALNQSIETVLNLAKQKGTYSGESKSERMNEPLVRLIENISNNTVTRNKPSKKISQSDLLEGIKYGFSEGARNDGLTSVAGLLHSRNIGGSLIHSFLTAINSNSSDPLEDRDVWNIANSVSKYSVNPLFIQPTGDDILTMKQAADKWLKLRSKTTKLNSGFKHIDNIVPYFDPGEVMFIAARSGCGKTSMGMQLSNGIAQGFGGYGLFASLEMPTTSLFVRSAIMQLSKERNKKMEYEEVTEELLKDRDMIDKVVDKWKHLLIIDKTSINIEQLKTYYEVANEKFNFGICNFLVDYVGLISGTTDYEGLSKVARGLKQIAKLLNTRIIVVVQLSRKAGDGTIPVSIDMLRDSGALEESADYILGMWLNKKNPAMIHCSFIKNRFGQVDQRFNIKNTGLNYTSEDYNEGE